MLAHGGIGSEQDLRFMRMTEFQELVLWEIRMCFDLIYGWHDSCVLEECGQGFNAEVGDADIFDFSCEFFFSSVRSGTYVWYDGLPESKSFSMLLHVSTYVGLSSGCRVWPGEVLYLITCIHSQHTILEQRHRPVHKKQVDVLRAKFLQAMIESNFHISVIFTPVLVSDMPLWARTWHERELGGEENLTAWDLRFSERPSNRFFVT